LRACERSIAASPGDPHLAVQVAGGKILIAVEIEIGGADPLRTIEALAADGIGLATADRDRLREALEILEELRVSRECDEPEGRQHRGQPGPQPRIDLWNAQVHFHHLKDAHGGIGKRTPTERRPYLVSRGIRRNGIPTHGASIITKRGTIPFLTRILKFNCELSSFGICLRRARKRGAQGSVEGGGFKSCGALADRSVPAAEGAANGIVALAWIFDCGRPFGGQLRVVTIDAFDEGANGDVFRACGDMPAEGSAPPTAAGGAVSEPLLQFRNIVLKLFARAC
jgi:hypothetical protein